MLKCQTVRILHVIQRYLPAQGGAEQHMGALSTYLAAAGHDVTVVTTDALSFERFWNPAQARIEANEGNYDGVRVLRFPVRHLPASAYAYAGLRRLLWLLSRLPVRPVWLMGRLARFTPWVPGLWRWMATTEERFDLVAGMTVTFESLLDAGQRLARRQGAPFVCYPLTHLGAGPGPAQDSLSRFYTMRHQIKLVVESDALVAQTAAEEAFYAVNGMDDERIVVVGPGVDPETVLGGDGGRFCQQYGIEGPVVLAIGSMSYDKGIAHTVEAVRRLWASGRQAELVLIGAVLEPFQRYLEGLPAQERERIHVLGAVDDQVKRDALAGAALLCLPSRTDSFGIVYLEAWLYGKPVIGARAWGVMDVIEEGRDGLLVPFGDAAAIAGAISYLLDHPAEAAAMGEQGRQKVYREHTWAQKCGVIEQLYERLVVKGNTSARADL